MSPSTPLCKSVFSPIDCLGRGTSPFSPTLGPCTCTIIQTGFPTWGEGRHLSLPSSAILRVQSTEDRKTSLSLTPTTNLFIPPTPTVFPLFKPSRRHTFTCPTSGPHRPLNGTLHVPRPWCVATTTVNRPISKNKGITFVDPVSTSPSSTVPLSPHLHPSLLPTLL